MNYGVVVPLAVCSNLEGVGVNLFCAGVEIPIIIFATSGEHFHRKEIRDTSIWPVRGFTEIVLHTINKRVHLAQFAVRSKHRHLLGR